jgi:CBS domain-containing protein
MSEDIDDKIKRLQVTDVMTKTLTTVDAERNVKETAIAMDRSGHGCLLVTRNGKVVGIVTERDLVRKILTKDGRLSRTKVSTIMSSPLVVVDAEAKVEEAASIMAHHGVRRLPVVGRNGLVGLITVTDIAKSLAEQLEYANEIFNAIARMRDAPRGLYG